MDIEKKKNFMLLYLFILKFSNTGSLHTDKLLLWILMKFWTYYAIVCLWRVFRTWFTMPMLMHYSYRHIKLNKIERKNGKMMNGRRGGCRQSLRIVWIAVTFICSARWWFPFIRSYTKYWIQISKSSNKGPKSLKQNLKSFRRRDFN